MDRRPLGRTGLTVSVIGMGTVGSFDTSEDRHQLVVAALEAHIDLFDTSPMYGRAERTLAAALGELRSRVTIATKVWTSDPEEGRRQAERALALYGHVDVYQVHNLVNMPVQLALLEALKAEGHVSAVGATHYEESAFGELARWISTGRLDMVQIPYNPLRRTAEKELLPLAERHGLGVLVMSPLQGGILKRQPSPAELTELGVDTWAQAILKWIASDRRVSAVLTATHRVQRAAENGMGGALPLLSAAQRDLVVRIAERRNAG
ncbi:MAG: aldo/keto reductase [Candidatus Dormibacterales bacterium]